MPRTALSGVFEDDMELTNKVVKIRLKEDPLNDLKVSTLPRLRSLDIFACDGGTRTYAHPLEK